MLKHLKTYKLFESIDESVVDTIKAYIDELKDSDDLGYWNVRYVPIDKISFRIEIELDLPDDELEWEQFLPEGWTEIIESLINFMEISGFTHVVYFDDGFETNVIHFDDLGDLRYYCRSAITIIFKEE